MPLIFAQDKPILENQIPKRLPLAPSAETPIVLMLLLLATDAGCDNSEYVTVPFPNQPGLCR